VFAAATDRGRIFSSRVHQTRVVLSNVLAPKPHLKSASSLEVQLELSSFYLVISDVNGM